MEMSIKKKIYEFHGKYCIEPHIGEMAREILHTPVNKCLEPVLLHTARTLHEKFGNGDEIVPRSRVDG